MALVAAGVAAAVYVVLVFALSLVVQRRLDSQIDQQIDGRLTAGVVVDANGDASLSAVVAAPAPTAGAHSGLGIYGAPVYMWQLSPSGAQLASSSGAPVLGPATQPSPLSEPSEYTERGSFSAAVGGEPFLIEVQRDRSGFLVAGESSAELVHIRAVLAGAELIAFPILLVVVFLASLAIAMRAVAPVEESRRKQLEFTADASHELRTPLSVLEAELSVARRERREPAQYEETLERVAHESARLRRIVDDLLWLARFDSEPPPPRDEPMDLGAAAEVCGERFGALATSNGIELEVHHDAAAPALVLAPPEWIDRLAGVLVDNACRYAGEGGTVRITASVAGNRCLLSVDDSGPGIPEAERSRLFDRFRRLTDRPGGHGLGLAIADSVVRSTGGRWRVADSSLGGARMEVSWPAAPAPSRTDRARRV